MHAKPYFGSYSLMTLSQVWSILGYGGRCMKDMSGPIRNRSFLVRKIVIISNLFD